MRDGEKLNTVYVAEGTRGRIDAVVARNKKSNANMPKSITAVVGAALEVYLISVESKARDEDEEDQSILRAFAGKYALPEDIR